MDNLVTRSSNSTKLDEVELDPFQLTIVFHKRSLKLYKNTKA